MVIRLSGEIIKRRKKLSKKYYGTLHVISKDEAKFVFEPRCKELVIGTGQDDNVRLSKEAAEYFDRKGCRVIAQPTCPSRKSVVPDSIDIVGWGAQL